MLELTGDGWCRELRAGDEVRFGRGSAVGDIVIADDVRLHRVCGVISVSPRGWDLHNVGRWLRIRVVSRDRYGLDSLLPGERIRVPWQRARVQVHVGTTTYEFASRFVATDRDQANRRLRPDLDGDDVTVAPVAIRRTSGYFRALVALCEPQLLDPSTSEIATDLQIALRLNRSAHEVRRVTGKTVERRLDSCREHFGLKPADDGTGYTGLDRRDARRVLVERALLTGTVTAHDLRLLEPGGVVGETPAIDV